MKNKPSLWQLIKEDFSQPKAQDPAYHSPVELFFNYPGVWSIINYRIAHSLHVKGFCTLARVIMGFSQFLTNVDIHPAATIGRRVFLDHACGIVVGSTTVIGDDVLIYQGVTLGGVSLEKNTKRHPTLKNNVVIGSGAKVLGNIIIGENSRIGSNSVVVKSVPDNSTAVGIPARVIKKKTEDNCPTSHDKLPDIGKELLVYLTKRVELLESALLEDSEKYKNLIEKDKELEISYENFIKALKE
ncbi:MAG: serine O-acetyltransferase [Campylobacteraceae bacterium]|nr:serine O-acetyltransferase [Campylobacteraceae bacterium]